jgi:hypothetical protein
MNNVHKKKKEKKSPLKKRRPDKKTNRFWAPYDSEVVKENNSTAKNLLYPNSYDFYNKPAENLL